MGRGEVVDLAARGHEFAIVNLVITTRVSDDAYGAGPAPPAPAQAYGYAAAPGGPAPPPPVHGHGAPAYAPPPAAAAPMPGMYAPPPMVSAPGAVAVSTAQPGGPAMPAAVPIGTSLSSGFGSVSTTMATAPGHGNPFGQTSPASMYTAYRQAWRGLFDSIRHALQALPPPSRAPHLLDLATRYPELLHESDFRQLAATMAVQLPGAGPSSSMSEAIALRGLTDLGRDLTGGKRGPETPHELSTFVARLSSAMRTLLKATLAQRDGVREVLESVKIEPDEGIRRNRTPEAIAARLLDWTGGETDESVAQFESDLTSLAVHHVAMLRGVMGGAKALLETLEPARLERELEDQAARNKTAGSTLGPFRFKTLWRLYEQQYSDLASEERPIFSALFGPKFAAAYQATRDAQRDQKPKSPREM